MTERLNPAGIAIVETSVQSSVVDFPGTTRLDYPTEKILTKALSDNLSCAVVIGYDANGDEYFASSIADGETVNWLLDRTKYRLMRVSGL
jgi:hypothetical protein